MRFDLSEEARGEWFKFFRSEVKESGEVIYLEPEEDAGRVCIRIGDPKTIDEIGRKTQKKVSEWVFNPKTKGMERGTYFDQTPEQAQKERELIWDFALQDWENLLDVNGKEIPCTLENKMRMVNIPQFSRFVGRCLQLISGAQEMSEEMAGKN